MKIIKILLCSCLLAGAAALHAQQVIRTNVLNEWPDTRYTDNGDGTVTDTITALMWAKCSLGQSGDDCSTGSAAIYTWQAALQEVRRRNAAHYLGHDDWRLPNVKELASLAAWDRSEPAINLNAFPGTPGKRFWSSSPTADKTADAWAVDFYSGNDDGIPRSHSNHVRLARSIR